MNRTRERALVNGLCARHGITRDVCPQYPMFLEALLTECIDEIIRGRMEDGPACGPVVSAMRRAGMRPLPSVWGAIEAQADATPAQVYEAAQAWLMNGNRVDDARGVLDWARTGKRSNREGREPARAQEPTPQRRYLPDDPAKL